MNATLDSDQLTADLIDAYRTVTETAQRLKHAFDKVEDENILNGKAIPLTRLLHSLLRTQIQLIDKIIRRRNTEGGEEKRSNPSRIDTGRVESTKPSTKRVADLSVTPSQVTPPCLDRDDARGFSPLGEFHGKAIIASSAT